MSGLIAKIRHIPIDYTETIEKPFGIECYYSTVLNKAIMYLGRSNKPLWHYRYSSTEEMMKRIQQSIDRITANKQSDVDRRKMQSEATKNMTASDHFVIGDIVVNSWGYEQTNVEFYEVIRVLNKKIEVREIAQSVVEGSEGHDSCSVLPVKGNFLERKEAFQLLLKMTVYQGTASLQICNPKSYYHFRKWSGGPQYNSWGY